MEFSASHRLWREDWNEERNREVFGLASDAYGHGHNYRLEVTLRGPVEAETGMVLDLKTLKGILDAEIGARFDHRNLNEDTPYFRNRMPTAENLAQVIFELLDPVLPPESLYRVRLSPTEDLSVEVVRS